MANTDCCGEGVETRIQDENRGSGYNDPILTDLIAQGTVEMDTDKFNEIWSEIQQMTIKDAPVASLYQLYGIYGISDEISWTPRLDEAILAFEITPAK